MCCVLVIGCNCVLFSIFWAIKLNLKALIDFSLNSLPNPNRISLSADRQFSFRVLTSQFSAYLCVSRLDSLLMSLSRSRTRYMSISVDLSTICMCLCLSRYLSLSTLCLCLSRSLSLSTHCFCLSRLTVFVSLPLDTVSVSYISVSLDLCLLYTLFLLLLSFRLPVVFLF